MQLPIGLPSVVTLSKGYVLPVVNERSDASTTDESRSRPTRCRQPRYHVRLWDDDAHSFAYVIRMMQELFAHTPAQARTIAVRVDADGSAVCLTTTREHAELKQDQIHAFGRDNRVISCKGSMCCTIEPEA